MHLWNYALMRCREPHPTTKLFVVIIVAGMASYCWGQTLSDSVQPPASESPYAHINQQAEPSRAGDVNATLEITHELFKRTAIPTEFADAFGFTDRIVNAEIASHREGHPRVTEVDVANAVNHLADAAGAPSWIKTNQNEVRKLRMHMLVLYPSLLASRARPDADGHRKAVSDDLGPVEAAYIATTMIYQKLNNPEYQFTPDEKKEQQSLDPDARQAKQNERLAQARDFARGLPTNHSARDLLAAGDRFFNDLGIAPVVKQDSSSPATAQSKGGL
jgi:hypothetical protein